MLYLSSATMQFQGKHIRVDMATAPRKVAKPGEENASEYDRSRTVFVGNVPFDVEVVTVAYYAEGVHECCCLVLHNRTLISTALAGGGHIQGLRK